MILRKWNNIPELLKNDEVKQYYDILSKKKVSLFFKRVIDVFFSLLLLIILSPVLIIIALVVKLTSSGPVFYKQERVTSYGRIFKIIKFRSMVVNADKMGTLVTVSGDKRLTKIGRFLRKTRLDETPQLINILMGQMSFVGTRPEVSHYVQKYSNEMLATLLMPAGVTSLASIKFKDEEKVLNAASDVDSVYINEILPQKMKYNLEYIKKFNVFYDIKLMVQTVFEVIK